jgi:response regulator RpfG family c-di-GMP phosphodiesterase
VKIYLVDDEIEVTNALEFRLVDTSRYSLVAINNLEAAEIDILGNEFGVAFIVVLDHDFAAPSGKLKTGYDLAQEIKSRSWMKGVSPIIYLTGRESQENFNAQKALLGGNAPDEFISKSNLMSQDLETRLQFHMDRLSNFKIDVDYYGLERAIEMYTDPFPL